jgi:hypothetical protein
MYRADTWQVTHPSPDPSAHNTTASSNPRTQAYPSVRAMRWITGSLAAGTSTMTGLVAWVGAGPAAGLLIAAATMFGVLAPGPGSLYD